MHMHSLHCFVSEIKFSHFLQVSYRSRSLSGDMAYAFIMYASA